MIIMLLTWIHKRRSCEKVVLEIMGDLSPKWSPLGLHRGVEHVLVRSNPEVVHQLDHAVHGRLVECVRQELCANDVLLIRYQLVSRRLHLNRAEWDGYRRSNECNMICTLTT